jgi:ubiquinol-cytochrome c reductase iron-sulfur subunit
MSDTPVDTSKRTWLIASGCAGAVGGAFVAVPFVSSFQPSERPRPQVHAVEADISALKPGEKMTVEWRGKPVWIMRRTKEQLAALPKTRPRTGRPEITAQAGEFTPEYARNEARSIKPECWWWWASAPTWVARLPTSSSPVRSPRCPDDWKGGFFCPCHGSTFDLAGRVFKNKPAPDNLEVPPHMYLSDTRC